MSDTPLATVAQLAAYLKITLDPADATATLLLDIASGVIRDYLDQEVTTVAADVVLLEPPAWQAQIMLPQVPVAAVSLVETFDGTNWNTADPSTYLVSLRVGTITGINVYPNSWPSNPGTWRVTYDHGFTDIPATLTGLTLKLAANQWTTPNGIDSESLGGYSVKYAMQQDFTAIEKRAIGKYMNPLVS